MNYMLRSYKTVPTCLSYVIGQKYLDLVNEIAYKKILRNSVHILKTLHDYDTHVQVAASTVWKATLFTWAELAPRCAGNAFVPTHICKLSHHLIQHSSFLLLLNGNHKSIRKIIYMVYVSWKAKKRKRTKIELLIWPQQHPSPV